MKNVRPLLLAASTVALLVTACSQAPADLGAPTLKPQYGTSENDVAERVAVNSRGFLYTLGQSYDTRSPGDIGYTESILTRFDRSGKTLWTRASGNYCGGSTDYCGVISYGLGVDTPGNSYTFTAPYHDEGDSYDIHSGVLKKYDAGGAVKWSRSIYTRNAESYAAMTTNPKGETYVAFAYRDANGEFDESTTTRLRKYSASGQKLWDVPLSVTHPTGIAVSASGNVFIVGFDHLAKYGAGGVQIWTRSLDKVFDGDLPVFDVGAPLIAISETNAIYIANRFGTHSLYRYDASGAQVWSKRVRLPEQSQINGLSTDTSGNVYLTGERDLTPENDTDDADDYFVRKYTASGSVVWTSTSFLPDTDEVANGVTAYGSGEIYAVGSTNARVNGKNLGKNDAFLLRLDAYGRKVWSR